MHVLDGAIIIYIYICVYSVVFSGYTFLTLNDLVKKCNKWKEIDRYKVFFKDPHVNNAIHLVDVYHR